MAQVYAVAAVCGTLQDAVAGLRGAGPTRKEAATSKWKTVVIK
jgi:hypothetical protein